MNIEKFKTWLVARGCEILPITNDYEALRFKGSQIGVLYTSGRVNSPYTGRAITCFQTGKGWDGAPVKTGRYAGYRKQKEALLHRDGDTCFYCSKSLGDDITVEHLIALSCGGKNELSNMVLAHLQCNQAVGNKPIVEKVKIAIKMRGNGKRNN